MRLLSLLPFAALAAFSFGQAKPMPGSTGTIGVPVRIGAYQVILTGASFATRLATSETSFLAEKGKKLLLLNFTVQNPGKTELNYDWGSIRFSVVGAGTDNFENETGVFNPDSLAPVNLSLKPAQKVPVLAVIKVPANDPIPKLIMKVEGMPVVRYDLKGKVKKFTGPYAAADGVTVNDVGSALIGEKADAGLYDLVLEKVEDNVPSPLGPIEAPEGKKLVVVTFSFTNASRQEQELNWGTFPPTMVDQNDEPFEAAGDLLRGTGTDSLNTTLKPGQSMKGRLVFFANKDATPKSLTLSFNEDNRRIVFKLK